MRTAYELASRLGPGTDLDTNTTAYRGREIGRAFVKIHIPLFDATRHLLVIANRVHAGILETYDGPLALATDLTVINVMPDHIEVRELSPDSTGWPQLPSEEYGAATRTGNPEGLMSDWLKEGIRR